MARVPAAMAAAPLPTSAPVLGIARTTGRRGRGGFERGEGDAGRDRQDERPFGQDLGAALERRDGVARLHREHQHLGVGGGPGRARHDPDPRQALLEVVAPLGVDLGDGQRLGLPAAVDQSDGQGFAHAPSAQQCQVHPRRLTVVGCATVGTRLRP